MINLAKKIVLSSLDHIKLGNVTIQDAGEQYIFGNNFHPQAIVNIKNKAAYAKMIQHGSLGVAQAYIDGDWEVDNLTDLIRTFIINEQAMWQFDTILNKLQRLMIDLIAKFKKNTVTQSKKHIQSHYDLGNDFFKAFLDDSLLYSCAIFESCDDSLHTAQLHKIKKITDRLNPKSDDHILEIGTGWGTLAIHLAQEYGCHVTTTTISVKQFQFVRQRIDELGLENQITLLNSDYRNITGQYDKIVSIEMIEAVGHQYFDTFFTCCDHLLKPGGLLMLQAIIMNEQAYDNAKKHVDFIRKYIFPGGCLPSIARISQSIAEHTRFQWLDLTDIGLDYVRTLRHWHDRFHANLDTVRQLGFSEEFIRMWQYYLSYCEAGFHERYISDVHLLFRKR